MSSMQFDKHMVDLVFQIKKELSFTLQNKIKLTDPELSDFIYEIYKNSRNTKVRGLAEQFLNKARHKGFIQAQAQAHKNPNRLLNNGLTPTASAAISMKAVFSRDRLVKLKEMVTGSRDNELGEVSEVYYS